MAPLLEFIGIGKSFPGAVALSKVNLVAERGEVHALVGANGAGKSTLINLLSGVFPPSSGVIRLDGNTVYFASPGAARAAGISTVYQELTVLPGLTVAENVYLGREPRNRWGLLDRQRLAADTMALLDRYKLPVDPMALVGSLSIAQRQIVELARALSAEARILILDEPTAVLSPAEQQALFRIIADLRAAGLLILYVSHRMEEIFAISDRVSVFRDGRCVATVVTESVDRRGLVRLMVGHEVRECFNLPEIAAKAPLLQAKLRTAGGESRIHLNKGEILGLAGMLGSGRTRLALALAGLIPGAVEEARLEGRSISLASPSQAIKHGIVYLTEDRKGDGIFANLPVLANVSAASLGRFSCFGILRSGKERKEGDALLTRLHLAARSLSMPIRELSGGNQQKALFGRALLCRPRILICDEPTRGIDVAAKDQIYEMLLELAAQGLGIVMISSELKELLALSHRLYIVRRGRVAEEVEPSLGEDEVMLRTAG